MVLSRQMASALVVICVFFLATVCFLQHIVDTLESDHESNNGLSQVFVRQRRQFHRRPHGYQEEGDWSAPESSNKDSHRTQYETRLDPSVIDPIVEALRTVASPLESVDETLPYSIHRCPETIPDGYPMQWSLVDLLSHWNPDNTTVPSRIYQGLCTVDWRDPEQKKLAHIYREAEVPFLVHRHPEVWRTTERWSHYDYLEGLLGGQDSKYRTEHNAHGNHMPYWKLQKGIQDVPLGWKAPTENVELSYPDWYSKAMELEARNDTIAITSAEHYYFRLNGVFHDKNGFLYDELPMFAPTRPSFFMPAPHEQRGINCRFGSKGIIAETHFDFSRNFILILQGQKRYILSHPNQCPNLELHPQGHPSARHSKIDWSNPSEWNSGNFRQATANEVVLQAGDALYLPTAWFHFIVSLNLNYQCNARSGITYENQQTLTSCGF